jgi:hypothetical protein
MMIVAFKFYVAVTVMRRSFVRSDCKILPPKSVAWQVRDKCLFRKKMKLYYH